MAKLTRKKQIKRYPEGHWVGIGLAIGMPLGLVIFLVLGFNYLPIGVAAGVAIGLSLGSVLEAKCNPNPRPLTKEEKRIRQLAVAAGVIIFLIGILVFFSVLFLL